MSTRAYFADRPGILRIIIGGLAIFFLAATLTTFYNYASSPTDQNIFTNPPSFLYVARTFPAEYIGNSPIALKIDQQVPTGGAVIAGDFLWGVDRRRMTTASEVFAYLKGVPAERNLELTIVRPRSKGFHGYRVRRSALPDSFIVQLSSAAQVTDVTPGGASDRAGMLVGDVIIRINGKEFKSANEADMILRRAQSGKTISYEVMREARLLPLNVTLAQFGFPLAILVFSLSGLVFVGVGSFIALKRPQIKAARLLGLSFMLTGFFIAIVLIRRDVDPSLFTAIRNIALVVSVYFGLAFAIDATAYFPRERPLLLSKRWRPRVLYGLAALMTLGSFILGRIGLLDGTVGVGIFLSTIVVMLLVSAVIKFIYRKDRSPEYKRLGRVTRYTGIAIAILGAVMIFALKGDQVGFIGFLIIFIPLAHLYTIGRYRLLDMNLRVRRNIQYTLVTILWGVLVGLVFLGGFFSLTALDLHLPNVTFSGLSIEIDYAAARGAERAIQERIVLMAVAIGLWYSLWKVRKWGQGVIDRKYYRTQYDYRRAAAELAEVLATKLTMFELGRGIVEKLAGLMHLKRAGVLFFRDGEVCCCHEALGVEDKPWEALCCVVDKELISAIGKFQGEFRVDYLPEGKKAYFQKNEFLYLVPIRSKDQLIGTLLLGEKLSEATYSQEDIEFLAAAAKQASVSIENAFLYEELAEKERMKHELAIARQIQLASLPQKTPAIIGLDIAGLSLPAMEVGGDFFDYLNGDSKKLTVVVGDVSGKGTSAALYMSKVQGILRSLHGFGLSPGELFIRANRLLCDDLEKKSFVTAIGADFDPQTRRLLLARAGHLPLYWYSAAKRSVEKITPRGLGLGLNNAGVFATELEEIAYPYNYGDVLLFVTDGVTEARNNTGDDYGDDRLQQLMMADAGLSAKGIRDHLARDLRDFAGDAEQHDDQTIVVVKVLDDAVGEKKTTRPPKGGRGLVLPQAGRIYSHRRKQIVTEKKINRKLTRMRTDV